MKKRWKKLRLLKIVLLISTAAITTSGVTAYLIDAQTVSTDYTMADVSLRLNIRGDTGAVEPGKSYKMVVSEENVGDVDAYAYVAVHIPYASVKVVDADGSVAEEPESKELYSYTVKDGWKEITTPVKDVRHKYYTHVLAYVGDDASTMEVLEDGKSTPDCISEVTAIDIEGTEMPKGTDEITFEALGIYTENIQESNAWGNDDSDGVTDPVEIFKTLVRELGRYGDFFKEYGLVDARGNQLASWETLVNTYGLDMAYDYDGSTYKTTQTTTAEVNGVTVETKHSSLYAVINDNKELFAKAVQLNIPDNVDLQHIGEYAAYNCSGLEYVELPEAVTTIGKYAFYNDVKLHYIYLPDELTTIAENAFCYADFDEVEIPKSVESVGSAAFYKASIDKLTWNPVAGKVTDDWRNSSFNATKIGALELGERVTTLPDYFLYNADLSAMTELDLKNVKSIGKSVFTGTHLSLEKMTFSEKIANIGEAAFNSCKIGLVDWQIPSITLPSNYYQTPIFNKATINSIAFADDVTDIPQYLFCNADVSGISEIKLPEAVKTIGKYAFSSSTLNLDELTIPVSVTSVGEGALKDTQIETLYWNVKSASLPTNYYQTPMLSGATVGNIICGDTVEALPAYFAANATVTGKIQLDGTSYGKKLVDQANLPESTVLWIPEKVTAIDGDAFGTLKSGDVTLVCEADTAPSGYAKGWSNGAKATHMGYTLEQYEKHVAAGEMEHAFSNSGDATYHSCSICGKKKEHTYDSNRTDADGYLQCDTCGYTTEKRVHKNLVVTDTDGKTYYLAESLICKGGYIPTDITGNSFAGVEMTYLDNSADYWEKYFGFWNVAKFNIGRNSSNANQTRVEFPNGSSATYTVTDGTQHTVKMVSGEVVMDGTTLGTYTDGGIAVDTTTTLDIGRGEDRYGYYTLYELKLLDASGDVIHDFVPVVSANDGTIGLMDTITNRFYSGTGTAFETGEIKKDAHVYVSNGDGTHTCSICGKTEDCDYHLVESSEGTESLYRCSVCGSEAKLSEAAKTVTAADGLNYYLLDSISGNGGYISTGLTCSDFDGIEICYKDETKNDWERLFGIWGVSAGNRWEVYRYYSNDEYYFYPSGTKYSINAAGETTLLITHGTISVNGTQIGTYNMPSARADGTFDIFRGGDTYGLYTLYRMKLYNSEDEIVHNYVPAESADGEVGLFDEVDKKFLPATGAAFSPGQKIHTIEPIS